MTYKAGSLGIHKAFIYGLKSAVFCQLCNKGSEYLYVMTGKPDPRIIDYVSRVRKKYRIEKAIFFGSRARGDNFKNSDFDVILVSPDFEGISFSKRIALMYDFWRHYPLEIEPLCCTPEEFEVKRNEIGIVGEAVREGMII
ncbi:MAG: nucleotidyltransferase domain-containing protein [Candidatus Altiarchaeota archaeon]|nr:nucleotidyltransferase domain-containing protein [Candidatus Altiarchaeota archaeon]